MQRHSYAVVVDGTPEEVWQLFWYRGDRPEHDGVKIEILHPGDEIGEGLIRHCTFRVPRYLLTGGVGHSWEWLTEVKPHVSWKYDAVGKPLWSQAEGRTHFEDLLDGRTKIHFTESYHAFNPVLRFFLEKRVHKFISADNDRLITNAVNGGLKQMRKARGAQPATSVGENRPDDAATSDAAAARGGAQPPGAQSGAPTSS